MAEDTETAVTEKAVTPANGAAAIEYKKSVKKDDYASGTVQWVFPAYGYNAFLKQGRVLPQDLPQYNRWAFYTNRDWTMMSTPYHEAMWANAIAIAVSKAAAWGWEVSGQVPLRRKRLQELLMYATAGVFVGWVPFISAHIRSYLLAGRAFVEIEREKRGYGSRIVALHHLNPLRVKFTDNPRKPIEYLDRRGRIHQLWYWQVMMFGDNTDPTDGDLHSVNSASERVYDRITTMEATHLYLYEKITGSRPLSIEFIQGITERTLKDLIASSDAEQERKGSIAYKGVVAVPIPGDVPVQRVTIPIAEVPDGFSYQEIHDNTAVDYCASIGLDVNDLDPRLAQRVSLGSGAQSIVLAEKAKGKGLASWRVDFTMQIHRLVASATTTYAWAQDTIDDELKQADLSDKRVKTRKTMQEIGEITSVQSKNMGVDAGDIPREYLDEDETADTSVDSDDNPKEPTATVAKRTIADETKPQTGNEQAQSEKEAEATKAADTETAEILAAEYRKAQALVKKARGEK